jgi:dienelactone hydrolase
MDSSESAKEYVMISVQTSELVYHEGTTELRGFLAYEPGAASAPGILIAPEASGVTEHSQRRARSLAAQGFVVLVADMFGDGLSMGPPAMERLQRLRAVPGLVRRRINASLQALLTAPRVEPMALAAIGYCFGGLCVLELARSGAAVAGVASFHGLLDPPTEPGTLRSRVLVCNGADDPLVSTTHLIALQEELRQAKVDWQLVNYGGAQHGFTNRDNEKRNVPGIRYDAAADNRSWRLLQEFLQDLFPSPRAS